MNSQMQNHTADHRYLLDAVTRAAGIVDPVAIDLDEFHDPLFRKARKGPIVPLDGTLVRDWDPDNRRTAAGFQFGLRLYTVERIRFVRVVAGYHDQLNSWLYNFTAVARADYARLYRIALRCRRDSEPPSRAPVLPQEQLDQLWSNTIGYLDGQNLKRIKEYGGRAKRGVLLTGPPGNGKTSACRWIWQECRRRRWEWRLVTPDAYRAARAQRNGIENLFSTGKRGVVFFDDMDIALRDRDTVHETEDQSVFLSALDGIQVAEGVVHVFTTNCALDLIDRAFKRPGRIDLVLQFPLPDALLRQQLMQRWHADIVANIDVDEAVASTDGYSFAEVEELKNLLILHFMDTSEWDWEWALRQFAVNRNELNALAKKRHVGFGAPAGAGINGK
jgi:hypothetical protein